MTTSPLLKKLRLHTARRALILNPPTGYLERLAPLPPDLELDTEPEGMYDCVHLFVKDRAGLESALDQALAACEYDALLWISYPKSSSGLKSDLNRDSLWKLLADRGIRPVTQVSIDTTWSALRFRPAERVGR